MIPTKLKLKISLLLAGLLVITTLAGCGKQLSDADFKPLVVTLLKVGKADAIIVQADGAVMVIDTGEEDDGPEVVEFLRGKGVSTVDALIITHFDHDHVGGADTLAESIDIREIYVPAYSGTSTEYTDFMAVVEKRGFTVKPLTAPVEFTLGDADVLIEPPPSYEPMVTGAENDNNFSLITTITHGENRMVFMGDAEKQRINEWLNTPSAHDCNFLKVPHHGVYNTALENLFKVVSPEIAVICTSNKHPADIKTVELLKQSGAQVLQTKDGNITVISSGLNLEINQKSK